MSHHSSRSSIPIDFIWVQYTVCSIYTQNDIWTPETEISAHKFTFCPSAPHVWRYDVASCTAHTFTGVASLCWMWRQWRYGRWALRVNLAHFLDVYSPKIVYTRTFTWIYLLNNLCLLKEEKTPVAMSTNSSISLVSDLLFLVYHCFTRRVPLIMGYVYRWVALLSMIVNNNKF
jgi:hypothetical protein